MLLEEEKLKLIKWYMGDYVYNDGMLLGGGGVGGVRGGGYVVLWGRWGSRGN